MVDADAATHIDTIRRSARQLVRSNLMLTGGNLSARVDDGRYLVTPTGFVVEELASLHTLRPIEVDLREISWPKEASSEVPIHSALYKRFPQFNGICHAHSPAVLALGEPDGWPEITTSLWKCMPVHVVHGQGQELADAAAETLAREDPELLSQYGFTILAPGHGLFSAATSIQRALHLVLRIDENAKAAIYSRSLM